MPTYSSRQRAQPVELAGGDVLVDGDLDQVGLRQRRRRPTTIAANAITTWRQYGAGMRAAGASAPRRRLFRESSSS